MMNYVYAFLAIILVLVVLKFILKLSIKIFSTIAIIVALVVTVGFVVIQPKMHKEFEFNIIQKMIKFNSDGSTSIIETTTTTERNRQ